MRHREQGAPGGLRLPDPFSLHMEPVSCYSIIDFAVAHSETGGYGQKRRPTDASSRMRWLSIKR
jgi:hypothetical protein